MLKLFKVIIFIYFIVLSVSAFGAFPDIGLGARPMGMGGAFVALADDANGLFWNPAGLSQIKRAEFSSMYLRPYGLENVSSQLISGTVSLPFDSGIGFGLIRTGETDLYMEQSLILGFGQDFYPLLNTHIAIGGSVKQLSKSYSNYDPDDRCLLQETQSPNYLSMSDYCGVLCKNSD